MTERDLFKPGTKWPRKELFAEKDMKGKKPSIEERSLFPLSEEEVQGIKEAQKRKSPEILDIINSLKRRYNEKFLSEELTVGIRNAISSSKITTCEGCNFSYILNYELEKLKPKEFAVMRFGTDTHIVTKNFNNGLYDNLEEMLEGKNIFVDGEKKRVWGWKTIANRSIWSPFVKFPYYKAREEYMKDGIAIFKLFYEMNKNKPKPLFVEKPFSFDYGGYRFNGVWDRVDETEDEIIITDYKSGWKKPNEQFVDFDYYYQLTIYALGYKEKRESLPQIYPNKPITLQIYHLRSGKVYKTKRNLLDAESLMRMVEKVNKDIREKRSVLDFDGFIDSFWGFHCGKCDLEKEICKPLKKYLREENYDKRKLKNF